MSKNKLVTGFFLLLPLIVWAVNTTITGSGNWSDTSNWSGGNIADDISEDATMNNNTGVITIQSGESFAIGDLNTQNGNTVTIDAGGSLTIGAMSNNKNLSTNNSSTINVDGDLEIWGNLVVNNNLILNVTGTLTIHGDINMGNGAGLDIQGDVVVDGDFIGGNNTSVNVDGGLDIGGDVTVGNGSDLTGSGTVDVGGSCAGPISFCSSGPLPITLLFFKVQVVENQILLAWATASEVGFDFFTIERSTDAQEFYAIATLPGSGFSESRIDYTFHDTNPILGRSFYRLKATDFDGTFEYFEIETVVFDNRFMRVFPNPLYKQTLKILISSEPDELGTLVVTSITGMKIFQSEVNVGMNEFDLGGLAAGPYLILVQTPALQLKVKMVIL